MGRWQKDRENAEGDSLSGSGQGTELSEGGDQEEDAVQTLQHYE